MECNIKQEVNDDISADGTELTTNETVVVKTEPTSEAKVTRRRRSTRLSKNDSLTSAEENPGPSTEVEHTPLRRSERRKSLPLWVRNVPQEIPKKSAPWSRAEKAQLLEGLKVAGDKNLLDLAKFVPTKKPFQIQYFINVLQRKAGKIIANDDEYKVMEMWSKKIKALTKASHRFSHDPLPIGLLLISLFEQFPSQQEACGVSFKGLYEYLFCLMSEQPLPMLDKKTKQFLYQSIKEVEADIKDQSTPLINALIDSRDTSEWPYNSKLMNPLNFPKVELNLEEDLFNKIQKNSEE